jgi:hypothetical protein
LNPGQLLTKTSACHPDPDSGTGEESADTIYNVLNRFLPPWTSFQVTNDRNVRHVEILKFGIYRKRDDIRMSVIPRHEGSQEVRFMLILSFTDPLEMLLPISGSA